MVFIPKWLVWFPLYAANLLSKKYWAAPTEFLNMHREKLGTFLAYLQVYLQIQYEILSVPNLES